MMLLVILSFATSVLGWGTLYSYTDGRIYLHLSNDELIGLNFSITGFDKSTNSASFDLQSGQKVETLASPPSNSTLFLVGEDLYGFTAGNSHTKDVCGGGSLSLIKFDSSSNSWSQNLGSLDYSGISDASYYQSATILTNPSINHTIYIYGGECSSSGQVSNRMLSLDIQTLILSNITTSTRPQPFYGAANLLAPNPQTQLVIGGQSSLGWLNMYQLATWDFNAGWSFRQIGDSSDGTDKVNSRKFPLVLPIFNQLDNSSIVSIQNQLEINEVLLIGGELLNTSPTPSFSKLSLNSNDWTWNSSFEASIEVSEILGAATIFNTLIVINSTSDSTKRDQTQYSINLYDTQSFSPVENLKKNVQTIYSTGNGKNNSSYKASVQKKAILGTVIPISALLIGLVGGIFLFNRRKQKQQQRMDEVSEIDYQFGTYLDNSSTRTNLYHVLPPPPNKLHVKMGHIKDEPNNETNSTLDVASFDSWMKKREEFDQGQIQVNRNSYLGSNETLSSDANPQNQANKLRTVKPQPSPIQYSTNFVNRSVSIIKKSFSFTNTPPISPGGDYGALVNKNIAMRNSSRPARAIDDEDDFDVFADSVESKQKPKKSPGTSEPNTIDKEVEEQVSDSDLSVDDTMDVQVLVSSKRRSVLKIVNPDLQTIEDVSENENPFVSDEENTNIRQRIPSGAKLLDE